MTKCINIRNFTSIKANDCHLCLQMHSDGGRKRGGGGVEELSKVALKWIIAFVLPLNPLLL